MIGQENRVFFCPVQPGREVPPNNFSGRLKLKHLENKVLDMMIMLEATLDTISLMEERYSSKSTQLILYQSNEFELSEDPISHSCKEFSRAVMLLKSRTEMLRTKLSSTMELVSR